MGLSSALYSGTSGLYTSGEKIAVIANNLANVNTVGFKRQDIHFEDMLYQAVNTSSGVGQEGRGVAISAIMGDFSQGSMESTSVATDVAIGGEGFFIVSPKGEEIQYYTRAGNFRFDKDGYLVDPHGYVVQGWRVKQQSRSAATTSLTETTSGTRVEIEGVPQDIKLENFQSPPQATSKVDIIVNLDSRSEDRTTKSSDPFSALFNLWDATDQDGDGKPIADTAYTYQTTIKVYDENGTPHNLTVYFDPVKEGISDTGGKQYWEFIVTVPPEDDKRTFWSDSDTKRGILMTGILKFNSEGQLEGISAYTLRDMSDTASGMQFAASNDPDDPQNWILAQFNQDGYPICTANFRGTEEADATNQENATNIAINFGARTGELNPYDWDGDGNTGASDPDDYPYLAGWEGLDTTNSQADYNITAVGTNPNNFINFADFRLSALSSTSYSSSSTTISQSQDGYTSGFLQNISISRDGVITGTYSNGQVIELFVLTLARFNNPQGLRREGGNLFAETRESGVPITGLPGTAGFGTIASNSLEQSNVDMAEEFVDMILAQRAFQANSRTIVTTDQMLQEVVNLKR